MKTLDRESFVAYPSLWRRALLASATLGFVVLGLWMVGAFGAVPTSNRNSYTASLIKGWACLIFFGPLAVAYVPKLFETGEQLRIDALGIKYSPWSHATIPWPEISAVTNWNYKRSQFIVLHLHHPNNFPGKGLAEFMVGPNRMLTSGDICISLSGTDRHYDDAMIAIDRYR